MCWNTWTTFDNQDTMHVCSIIPFGYKRQKYPSTFHSLKSIPTSGIDDAKIKIELENHTGTVWLTSGKLSIYFRFLVVGFSKPASFALSFSKATSFAISFSFSAAICPHFSVLFAIRLYFRWLRMKSSTTQRSRNVFKVGYFFTT